MIRHLLGSTVNRIIFLEAFLSKGNLSPFCEKVAYQSTNKVIYRKTIDSPPPFKLHFIKDVPAYLEMEETIYKNTLLKTYRITTQKGFLINLKKYSGFNDYLKDNLGASSRSSLRRYQNRLESCFSITYKHHYGEIEKEEYNFLFRKLKKLIIRRYNQKKEFNYELQHLKEFQLMTHSLILKKKASIFVIYHEFKPISIRINMFYGPLAFYILSCYDIDYSKFHIGAIDMLKNIDWCFKNNYETYDLLKGYHYYKKKWMTNSYENQNHIIYNPKRIKEKIIASSIYLVSKKYYDLFHLGKKLGIDILYKKYKKLLFTITLKKIPNKHITVVPISNNSKPIGSIDFLNIENDNQYAFLRKPIYDLLYSSRETYGKIKIYAVNEYNESFFIEGEKKKYLLTVH